MSNPAARAEDLERRAINLRIGAGDRQLIDSAAALLGKTRTQFMIDSAKQHAVDVILDQRLFALDTERYEEFLQMLDAPHPPGEKLMALMRRTPPWRT